MPEDTPNAADTQTAEEQAAVDFISGMNEDAPEPPVAPEAVAGEQGTEEEAEDKQGGDSQGEEGAEKSTPPEKPEAGDLPEFRYRLNPDHKAFFEGRGLVRDGNLDVDTLAKSFKDNLKYVGDVNSSLSHMKGQLQSLRGKTETTIPQSKQEVEEEYQSSLAELKKVWDATSTAKAVLARTEGNEKIIAQLDDTLAHLQSIDAENRRAKDEKIEEARMYKIRKELGLSMPQSDEVSPDRAKTLANEAFEKHLDPKEIADKEFLQKILQPGRPFLHGLAATTYPHLYDPEQPNGEKSTEALHRIMMDEKVAEMVVDYGRAKIVAEGADEAKRVFGEAEYKRGMDDMRKQMQAGGGSMPPSTDAVKKIAVSGSDGEDGGAKFVSELIAESNQ